MNTSTLELNEGNEATYCPEDNKLRLYVGRVPREEFLELRAEGWKSTPKQDCDFVASWTVTRENTALAYSGGTLSDEDQSPQDRAADRAERFAGYREKREAEAYSHESQYLTQPTAHGYQSQAIAERKAKKHDLQATKAVNQWEKAEYWTTRTAGVISHALYVSAPGVRMGRIKKLESALRKREKEISGHNKSYEIWEKAQAMEDGTKKDEFIIFIAGRVDSGYGYLHPRQEECKEYFKDYETSLYSLLTYEVAPITSAEAITLYFSNNSKIVNDSRYVKHLKLRLEYENQMLEAQGGRAAAVDMIAGGFIGAHQIQKVNKSPATGRVVSVNVIATLPSWQQTETKKTGLMKLKTERLDKEVYRAPTPEELEEFNSAKKEQQAQTKKANAGAPKIWNLTREEAEKMQKVWNIKNGDKCYYSGKEHNVIEMTQAAYSSRSKGSYASASTVFITDGGNQRRTGWNTNDFPAVAKIRSMRDCVVIITDKPQKKLPPEMWEDPRAAVRAELIEKWELLETACNHSWINDLTEEERAIFDKALLIDVVEFRSQSQFAITEHLKPEPVREEGMLF